MRTMGSLFVMIESEIIDAEKYAGLYESSTAPEERTLYKELSEQELQHAAMLHGQAERLKLEYEASGRYAPESMRKVWKAEHDKIVERENAVHSVFQ